MGLACLFGHKLEDYACVRRNCTAIQLEGMFSAKELVTLGLIAQFLHDTTLISVIDALKAKRDDILNKTASMLETIILKGLISAKEKGWEAHSVELGAALLAAAKELASKNPGMTVNDTFGMDSIDDLILKVLRALQASGAVSGKEKESFKQIALGIKSQPQQAQPVKQKSDTVKPKTILDRYREALSFLDKCDAFDETTFREFNSITGNMFPESAISTQLKNAQLMIGGMSDLKNILRSNMVEAISTFEQLERQGIDLSNYNV